MTSATTDPLIDRLIDGRYQVRSRIARGGMATVYVANDLRLDRRVAIKIMHGHLADDEAFRERFVREAHSAARLAHPNVVSVFDQGQDDEMAYMVMEYLPGMTLRDLLKDYGRLTTEQTLDIMEAVLGGLAAAHKAGIVHRDVKPENVLLADDGRIKIGDFGLARAASANTATGQALLGTIAYLSPELLTRGVADARSDIYAAGIMMYEMLVGQQPYLGDQPMQIAFQHANETVPPPSAKNPAVPAEIDELVRWATTRDPDARPHDAREMLDELIEAQATATASIRATTALLRTSVMPPVYDPLADAETEVLRSGHTGRAMPRTPPRTSPAAAVAAPAPGPVALGASAPGAVAAPVRPARAPKASERSRATVNPADTLAKKSRRRRRRGWWVFALVIVLGGLAAGGGWYFSSGPGGQLSIPNVAGGTPESAEQTLGALGLTVTQTTATDPTIAAGTVLGTDPGDGSRVLNGSSVAVIVSAGPAMLTVPDLNGMQEAAAKQSIQTAGFTTTDSQTEFSTSVAKDAVIRALGADGQPLGATYPEQRPITLIVSLGSVPNVVGKSVDDATAALTAVDLKAATGSQDYSDTVAEGDVISYALPADPVKPGATITLQVSKGSAPVAVPDVVTETWTDAKKKLQDAGFLLSYNQIADTLPNAFKVSAIDPAAGQLLKKGSTITVSFSVF